MMKFSLWISRRLRLRGADGSANSTGVVIAVTGVALAVIILEFTLAVVLGFKDQITRKLMGFDGQVSVLPAYDSTTDKTAPYISMNHELANTISAIIPGAGTELVFRQPGILKTDDNFAGIIFNAHDNNHDVSFEKGNIIDGEFPDYSISGNHNKIVISSTTARDLGLMVGDKVYSCFFINGAIKSRRHEIAGIYESNFGEYDKTVAYSSLSALQKIAGVDSLTGTYISIGNIPLNDIVRSSAALQEALIHAYQEGRISHLYPVDNVKHSGAVYFNWLELLDTNVIVIFILMLCVAGFTLVSSLFIIILERISMIGILRSLGATKRQIRNIFVNMALRLVGMGMAIGNIIGIGAILIQEHYSLLPLNPDMYYLRHVPVEIDWWWIVWLNIGIMVSSWCVLILPSRLASSVSPAKTMRFE